MVCLILYYKIHTIRITSLLINDSKIYAGTQDKGIYISTDKGYSWKSINNGLQEFHTISAILYNGKAVFAVCGNIYRLLNGNNVWEKTQTGIQGNDIVSIAYKDSILFALSTKALYSSSDNGINWNEVYAGSLFDSGSLVGINILVPCYIYLV